MNDAPQNTPEREPEESGSEEVQQPSTTAADLSLIKSSGEIQGHPLPVTLRDLGPAFRSQAAWLLISQWATLITKDSDELKRDLAKTLKQLEEEKIHSAALQERLKGFRQIASLNRVVHGFGALAVGLSPALYLNIDHFYGSVLFAIGIVMIIVGLVRGRLED